MSRRTKFGRIVFLFIAIIVMTMALKDGVCGEKGLESIPVITMGDINLSKNQTKINMESGFIVGTILLCGFVGCVLLAKKNGQFFWRKE